MGIILKFLVIWMLVSIQEQAFGVIIPHTGLQTRHEQKALNYSKNPELASVGKLTIVKKDGKKEICTGTLITKRHVLTAGHCVYQAKSMAFSLVLGNGTLKDYSVEAFSYNSRYIDQDQKKISSYDVAVVTLKRDVREHIVLPQLYNKTWDALKLDITNQTVIRSVGFGIIGRAITNQETQKLSSAGLKLAVKIYLEPYETSSGNKYLISKFHNPTQQIWPPLPTTYGTQAPGDSGSPNFLQAPDGRLVLIALHAKTVKKGELSAYEEQSYKAPITENLDFILSHIPTRYSSTENPSGYDSVTKNQGKKNDGEGRKYEESIVLSDQRKRIEESNHKQKYENLSIHPGSRYFVKYPAFLRTKLSTIEGKLKISGRFEADQMVSKGDVHVTKGGYLIAQEMTNEGGLRITKTSREDRDSFYQSQKTQIKGGKLDAEQGITNIEKLTITDHGTVEVVSQDARLNAKEIYVLDGEMILAKHPNLKIENLYIVHKGQLVVRKSTLDSSLPITMVLSDETDEHKPYILLDSSSWSNSKVNVKGNKSSPPPISLGLNQGIIEDLKKDKSKVVKAQFTLIESIGGEQDFSKLGAAKRPRFKLIEKYKKFIESLGMTLSIEYQNNRILAQFKSKDAL